MSSRKLTTNFTRDLLQAVRSNVGDTLDDNSYYTFIGDHTATARRPLNTSPYAQHNEVFRRMIMGKAMAETDLRLLIRNNLWLPNRVYAMYDDRDPDLFEKNFFVLTINDDEYIVWKCLFNNYGAESTQQPSIQHSRADDFQVQYEQDGYHWKYMFTVPRTEFDRFVVADRYIPVGKDDTIPIWNGAITHIVVEQPGARYDNYYYGVFDDESLVVISNNRVLLPEGAVEVVDFYKNTILYVPASGRWVRIYKSSVDPIYRRVALEFEPGATLQAQNSQEYQVTPEVRIFGGGYEDPNNRTVARTYIEPAAANSVSRVDVLEPGRDYAYAVAEVLEGTYGTVDIPQQRAIVRPILPPPGGHGSNPAAELDARTMIIVADYEGGVGETVPVTNTFAQFGILRNPQFANVEVSMVRASNESLAGVDGESYVRGENVLQFVPTPIEGGVSVSVSGNTTIVETSNSEANLNRFISRGDYIYLTNTGSDVFHFISKAYDVSATEIFIEGNASWADTPGSYGSTATIARLTSRAVVADNDESPAGIFYLDKVERKIEENQLLIGEQSFAIGNVTNVRIHEREFAFSFVIQATVCSGSGVGEFQLGDTVFQGISASQASFRAKVHSAITDNSQITVYLTETEGSLRTDLSLTRDLSSGGVIARLDPGFDKYNGEFDPTAGEILYLQNDVPIERSPTSKEQIRVILEL